MNGLVSFILVSLSIGFCYGQKLDPESKAIVCMKVIYYEQGLDLSTSIEEYEAILLAKGYLRSTSGKDYHQFLKKLVRKKSMQIDSTASYLNYDLYYKLERNIRKRLDDCSQDYLFLTNGEKSKWQIIYEDTSEDSSRDNAWFCRLLIKHLTEKDFENEFYKLKAFVAIDFLNETWGSRHMLEPIPEKNN